MSSRSATGGGPGRVAAWWRSHPSLRGPAWLLLVIALALGVACAVLRVWQGSLRVPFFLNGIDSPAFVSAVKGIVDHGWYFSNPSLGAPAGQDLIDFAGGNAENLQWLVVKFLALLTGDAAVTTNLYVLLSFPAIAAATWLVLRRLGGSRLTSLVAALLLALAPFHFAQLAMGHVFLAAYVAVPLAGWLVIRAMRAQPLFTRSTRCASRWAWVSWRNALMVAAIVVIGGSTLYYAFFSLLLLMGAAIIGWIVQRSWRGLIPAVMSIVGIGVVLLLNLLPGLVYRMGAGPNPALASRRPFESEVFSLSLTQLLAPVQGHRVGALARAYEKSVESTTIVGERGNQLGLLLAVTLVCGLFALCAWAVAERRPSGGRRAVASSASVGALMAILVGTFGGVSSLIAIYVTPQLRVWSRLTPFIAFFSAVLLVMGLDWVSERVRPRLGARWVAPGIVVGIGVLGVLDQAPPRVVPAYAANAAAWDGASSFVRKIEASTKPGAKVLQLPYVPFPESGAVGGVEPYDHLSGYLHSEGLNWSFGAVRGRDADWHASLAGLPLGAAVDAAAAAGFAGVYVDTAGYPDGGAAVRAAVEKAVGHAVTPITSPGGRRQFLPLDGARERLDSGLGAAGVAALARNVTEPVGWSLGPGFYGEETDGTSRWNWATSPATLTIRNTATSAQRVRIRAEVEAQDGSTFSWSASDGQRGSMRMAATSQPLSFALVVPPGGSSLTFTATGGSIAPPPDGRDLRLNLRNLSVEVVPPAR